MKYGEPVVMLLTPLIDCTTTNAAAAVVAGNGNITVALVRYQPAAKQLLPL